MNVTVLGSMKCINYINNARPNSDIAPVFVHLSSWYHMEGSGKMKECIIRNFSSQTFMGVKWRWLCIGVRMHLVIHTRYLTDSKDPSCSLSVCRFQPTNTVNIQWRISLILRIVLGYGQRVFFVSARGSCSFPIYSLVQAISEAVEQNTTSTGEITRLRM